MLFQVERRCTANTDLPGLEGRSAQSNRACPRTELQRAGILAALMAGGPALFEKRLYSIVSGPQDLHTSVQFAALSVHGHADTRSVVTRQLVQRDDR